MALIVYGGNISPFVRKVRVVLAEKGLQYTLESVNPFQFVRLAFALRPRSVCRYFFVCELIHMHASLLPTLYKYLQVVLL